MKNEDKANLRQKLTDLRRDIQKLEEESLNNMPPNAKAVPEQYGNLDTRARDARKNAYEEMQKLRLLSDNAAQMLLNVSEL
jgi:hypothetical protein